jgi:hypothetical protein
MRKAALLATSLALIGVVLGFSMFGGAKASVGRPELRVVGSMPLTIRGEHFRAQERVRLTAAAKVTRTTAHGGGTFVVTIRGATRCDTVRVLARGSAGSYAVVKVLPSPACLAARSG